MGAVISYGPRRCPAVSAARRLDEGGHFQERLSPGRRGEQGLDLRPQVRVALARVIQERLARSGRLVEGRVAHALDLFEPLGRHRASPRGS